MNKIIVAIVLVFMTSAVTAQKVVRYDLVVKDTMVNFTGKSKRAIAVNGQIPMPTLTFTEGDTAEIHVFNKLNEGTALHWHGLMLPNKEDGVPFLTQLPIPPGTEHVYRFAIIQNGTHWYHSHFGLQEQIGMYGNFVMLKKKTDPTFRKGIDDLPTVPVVLSEWTDYRPENVHRMLHNASDWFAIKKNTTQSYAEAIAAGHFKTKLNNEWKRMLAMDVSDVYYDRVFMNGQVNTDIKSVDGKMLKAGDKVRLRVSNGGASSYFWLKYAGGKITVVANDGNDVEPVEVDRLLIAVSETYDVVVTIPVDNTAFEFLATTEDRIKSASVYIGNGVRQLTTPMPKLKYFEGMKMMNGMMKMNGNLDDMGMKMSLNQMDMNVVMYPEITGEAEPMEGHQHMKGMKMNHGEKNMDEKKMPSMNMDHGEHKMNMGDTAMQGMKMEKQGQTMDHGGMNMPGMKMEKQDGKMDMGNKKMPGMNMTTGDGAMNMEEMYNSNAISDIVTLNYAMLKSPVKTVLPKEAPVKELRFVLTGNMNRYVWSLDNKVLSETDKILIRKGENIRMVIYNNSMMRHPMHLHGHDFRLLNGKGDYSPLMNVVDIMPMETDTLEFNANAEGDWFFHCHILYHMMSGMGRVFSYQNQAPNPYIPNANVAYKKLKADDRRFHFMAENDFATNGNDGMFMFQNTRWSIGTEWNLGYHDRHGYETETHIGRYLGKMQWVMPFVGYDWRYRKLDDGEVEKTLFGQKNSKDNRSQFTAGINFTLPMLLMFQTEIFDNGDVRLQLMREDIPITKRLRMSFMANTDKEYMGGFKYIVKKNFSLTTHYDSDMGFGVGFGLNY